MIDEKFKYIIAKRLKRLTTTQVIEFTWRCAIRTLPFVGYYSHFNFWRKNDIPHRLYEIFFALDLSIANIISSHNLSSFGSHFTHEATLNSASQACEKSALIILKSNFESAEFLCTSIYAAANATDICLQTRDYNFDSAISAAVDLDYTARKFGIRIRKEILTDINDIRNEVQSNGVDPHKLYGNIWSSFAKALKREKCHFWLHLYEDIIKKGFDFDINAAEKRLRVNKDIRQRGAVCVATQIKKIEIETTRLNESRIILLGEKGAGKTCLARRIKDTEAPMTKEEESTPGVDTSVWKLVDKDINIHIWDFAGHTVTHAVHRFFLSTRCLYIIVYDGRSEERNRLLYWLDHMKNYGGDSKVIIVVNKRDGHNPSLPINSLKEKYPILKIVSFSIKKDIVELNKLRELISDYISKNSSWSRLRIPRAYFSVKADLEIEFGKKINETETECISKEQFNDIANKYKVEDKDSLLSNLHSLGITLWYKDMPQYNTLILNPEWISHGVYKIINWVSNNKVNSISINDLKTVFNSRTDLNRYPEEKHRFLFDLMKHYELAFETHNDNSLIIPHLLSEDRPSELPEFGIGESLMIRYKAEQALPPNTISRFIVRHSNEIKSNNVWRLGVLLEDDGNNIALVREDDRTISVSVKGANKKEYLSKLRATLNVIFESYKSNKPELQYRIQRFGEIPPVIEEKFPIWLRDRKIVNHSNASIPYYEDVTQQPIDLNHAINIYNITTDSFIKDGNIQQLSIKKEINNFNLNDCNLNLQSHINELSQMIEEAGLHEESQSLSNVASALELAESFTTPEEFKKRGTANRLKRLINELGDESSTLNKTIKGVKNGINIAQELAAEYNKLADWMMLPQVPKFLLKKS